MKLHSLALSALFAISLAHVACSSDSDSDDDSNGDDDTGSCSCTVDHNGEKATLKCGEEKCVGETTYTCSSSAEIEDGARCTPSTSSSSSGAAGSSSGGQSSSGGSSSSSSGGGGSSSSSGGTNCATTFECGSVTCNRTTQWCDLSAPNTPSCINGGATQCVQSQATFGCTCTADDCGAATCQ